MNLDDFERGIAIDSMALRTELDTMRSALGKTDGKLSETTFGKWRSKAGCKAGIQSVSQIQAVLILWQALYQESGKKSMRRHCRKSTPLAKISILEYRKHCNDWLQDGDIPVQGLRVLSWIRGVAVTPAQLATLGQSDLGKPRRGLSLRSLQRAAAKENVPLPKNKPLSQRFVRRIVSKTILKRVS